MRGREKDRFNLLNYFYEDDESSVKPRCMPRSQLFEASKSVYSNVSFSSECLWKFICRWITFRKTNICVSGPFIRGFEECKLQCLFSSLFGWVFYDRRRMLGKTKGRPKVRPIYLKGRWGSQSCWLNLKRGVIGLREFESYMGETRVNFGGSFGECVSGNEESVKGRKNGDWRWMWEDDVDCPWMDVSCIHKS